MKLKIVFLFTLVSEMKISFIKINKAIIGFDGIGHVGSSICQCCGTGLVREVVLGGSCSELLPGSRRGR